MEKIKNKLKDMTMVFVLIGLLVIFFILCQIITGRNFLSLANLLNILGQNAYLVIIGVGITFIMLGGGMDLSTGYLVSTVGISMALINLGLMNNGMASFPAFLIAAVAGVALATGLSAINGVVYAWLKVFPFIITLAMQYILNGATYLLSGGMTQTYRNLSNGFKILGGYNIKIFSGNLKTGVLVMILMVLIGSFILNKTRFGRNVYALGSNPEAVALSGVSVAKMRIAVFALAGVFFGIAQIVNIGRIGSVNNSMGVGTEFTVMAGAMLGGVKMGGGGGKMSNMVVGVLIIGVLNSGMNFLNLSQYWQYVALGIVLLAAIILDTLQTENVQKRAKLVTGQDPALLQKTEE
ncbi:MAG: ABC transporter permease [Oscillospiraceae bacterium]|nr:ABC transporter permease [Oscillospiraceae bacterium]